MHRTLTALALALPLLTSPARAAGLQLLDDTPELKGAIWTPCTAAAQEVPLGKLGITGVKTLPGVKDCPISGNRLPLIVFSHGRGGWFGQHHDVNEALADAGFIVVSISHPGDSFGDDAQRDSLSVWLSRPQDIMRLIDFMLQQWTGKAAIDPGRIGFFGFSRGGYTGTVLAGVDPDFGRVAQYCTQKNPFCEQVHSGKLPTSWPHDPRIKAAVLADAAHTVGFTKANLASIKIPLQVWRSELGGNGVDPEGTARVTASLPGSPEVHTVPAAHFAFLAPCSAELAAAVPRICADTPVDFDRAAFHRTFDAEIVRFFSDKLGH
ncbi:hydrolase [Bradyrhizobium sp. SRS-191]|uniref:alpha/beta hydrolase family protein n=1 Tax=Bradyrhizobium sp. SRS-191 TaxID=2962606 RepID=UPI00211E0E84|nr:hydrolase [Bradyrhizobium sp. SRS-191]